MIRVFTRQMEKLHSEEGQALVFVAMVGLVIFLFVAMTMNLAELINTKIKSQNVADAVALSGAAWQARALNTIAAMNEIILSWWMFNLPSILAIIVTLATCTYLCCNWTCGESPLCWVCLGALLVGLLLSIQFLVNAMAASSVLHSVVDTLNLNVLQQDLPQIADLNYEFKLNTRDLRTGAYLYTHENNGNLWADMTGGAGYTRYVLEPAGLCELMIGLFYYACRVGGAPSCRPDWRAGWQGLVGGTLLPDLYRHGGGPPGPCYRSSVNNNPFFFFPLPWVLHTYHKNNWHPEDFEELLPVTVGVYRERQPPTVHLWGSDLLRSEMNCDRPPWGKTNLFPCTDQGHFAFATAHSFSQYVYDFYRSLADFGITTPYPIPLVFADMDWQQRLYAVEPRQEMGEESPECGWQAYSAIADQIDGALGLNLGDYLRDNVLENPDHPNRAFFLY